MSASLAVSVAANSVMFLGETMLGFTSSMLRRRAWSVPRRQPHLVRDRHLHFLSWYPNIFTLDQVKNPTVVRHMEHFANEGHDWLLRAWKASKWQHQASRLNCCFLKFAVILSVFPSAPLLYDGFGHLRFDGLQRCPMRVCRPDTDVV